MSASNWHYRMMIWNLSTSFFFNSWRFRYPDFVIFCHLEWLCVLSFVLYFLLILLFSQDYDESGELSLKELRALIKAFGNTLSESKVCGLMPAKIWLSISNPRPSLQYIYINSIRGTLGLFHEFHWLIRGRMLNTWFPFTPEVYKCQRLHFFLIPCQCKKKGRMLILYCMFFFGLDCDDSCGKFHKRRTCLA